MRHYHRLGLLPAPPTVRGKREYGTVHLARLMRIRWLAEGGLSLAQIAEVLAGDPGGADRESVLHSLRAERQVVRALAALGLVPDSVGAFLAGLDSSEWDAGVRIYAGIARLEQLHGDAARTADPAGR